MANCHPEHKKSACTGMAKCHPEHRKLLALAWQNAIWGIDMAKCDLEHKNVHTGMAFLLQKYSPASRRPRKHVSNPFLLVFNLVWSGPRSTSSRSSRSSRGRRGRRGSRCSSGSRGSRG